MNEYHQERLKATEYVIEATHAEMFYLWCLYAKESSYEYKDKGGIPKAEWKDESRGFYEQIGTLAEMPVVVSGSWAIINGKRVLFIEMTSQVCDYRLLEPWLEENCPNVKETMDAMNFGRGFL